MKITKKRPVKEAVKEKAKAIKQKVKGRVKGCAALVAFAFAVASICGCMTPEQASRSTEAQVGDVESSVKVSVDEKANPTINVNVRFNFGDGAIASADSSGSNETQTQTPTFDISPKTDVRYNDAISGATAASKTTLGLIGDGITGVLDMMASKKSGTVAVTKTDGSAATVKCENGQCEFCEDCTPQ